MATCGNGPHVPTSLVTLGVMGSFAPFAARLPGAWFRLCFGWLAPGGGWFGFLPAFLLWGCYGFGGPRLGCCYKTWSVSCQPDDARSKYQRRL